MTKATHIMSEFETKEDKGTNDTRIVIFRAVAVIATFAFFLVQIGLMLVPGIDLSAKMIFSGSVFALIAAALLTGLWGVRDSENHVMESKLGPALVSLLSIEFVWFALNLSLMALSLFRGHR